MKAAQREPWVLLGAVGEAIDLPWSTQICQWCKYMECVGCCGAMECRHSLDVVQEYQSDNEVSDCWAFRPNPRYRNPEDAVEQVALWIREWDEYERQRQEIRK